MEGGIEGGREGSREGGRDRGREGGRDINSASLLEGKAQNSEVLILGLHSLNWTK